MIWTLTTNNTCMTLDTKDMPLLDAMDMFAEIIASLDALPEGK